MTLLWVFGQGEVDIEAWEWALGTVYVTFLYIYFARLKNVSIKKHPEYKHMIWGLSAKMVGGVAFSLIYFYYYKGGDTIMYFYSSVALSNMAKWDLLTYLDVVTGPNSEENLMRFNDRIGYPFAYMYFDSRSYFVIRLISPLALATFNSYLITTLVLSSLSYFGIWRCYRTFVSYYPALQDKLAIAFLYMPSVVFWGSGIMKDTFTMSATCWWVHCVDEFYFKRRSPIANLFGAAASAVVLVVMKPYIFMTIFPVTVAWILYYRVARIRSGFIKFLALPVVVSMMLGGSFYALTKLGDRLDKFSLDRALTTAMVIQGDMKRADVYGGNYFDIGPLDGTLPNLLSKFPVATNAALFRPYIWESRSVVVALSGLENLWLLGFFLLILWRTHVLFFLRLIYRNPLVMMCFLFTVLFAFSLGISTPNFGALVRFKIPLVPFMVAGMYIITYLNAKRVAARRANRRFDLGDFVRGDPKAMAKPALA
ncbi:MAG: hypothetical protein QY325_00185 [Flavobacteriales bacterium]|jgi:hypothetical protein|nr:MAG: hypothetical protein QY325_00185 [Flavobacteriales bacterium]